ncbi:MAG: ATP-binding protein, partial [Bacteroidota bacterium]
MASAGAVRMEDLLNDLYQHAQVGRSREDFKTVEMDRVVKDVLHDLSVSIKETGAKVVTEPLPVIKGYQTELRMLLQNLISNGIKFTQPGTQPKVLVRGGEENGHWFIEVADQGIGIPEAYQEKIFGIFERLHSRDEFPGSGIGLATCQKVVNHHGG